MKQVMTAIVQMIIFQQQIEIYNLVNLNIFKLIKKTAICAIYMFACIFFYLMIILFKNKR